MPSEPTAAWLSKVTAPYKQGVWFERSSHMIMWEEPGKTLTSLLEYVRPLAEPADKTGRQRRAPEMFSGFADFSARASCPENRGQARSRT